MQILSNPQKNQNKVSITLSIYLIENFESLQFNKHSGAPKSNIVLGIVSKAEGVPRGKSYIIELLISDLT